MEIEIHNFRCHQHLVVSLSNGIVLLDGESGAGKTTIMSAILWCLHGKMRQIDPGCVKSKARTSVTVTFNKIIIKRMSGPKILHVRYSGQDYQDSAAQSIIDDHVGSKAMFESLAYVAQKELCTLVSGTSREKMDLLRDLIFKGGSPLEKYSEKIKSTVSQEEFNYTLNVGGLTHISSELQQLEQHVKQEDMISSEDLQKLQARLEQRTCDLDIHRKIREKNRFVEGQLQSLTKDIEELESSIAGQPEPPSQNEIDHIASKLSSEKNILVEIVACKRLASQISSEERNVENYRAEVSQLQMKIDSFPDMKTVEEKIKVQEQELIDANHNMKMNRMRATITKSIEEQEHTLSKLVDIDLSDGDIRKEQEQWKDYKINVVNARRASLVYSTEAVSKEINKLSELLGVSKKMASLKRKMGLEQRVAKIKEMVKIEIDPSHLAKAQEKLTLIRMSKKSLRCPTCSASLVYNKGELVFFNSSLDKKYTEEQAVQFVSEIEESLKLCNERRSLEKEIEVLREECGDIEHVEFNPIEVASRLSMVKGIKVIPQPKHDEILLSQQYQVNEIKKTLADLNQRLSQTEYKEVSQNDVYELDLDLRKNRENLASYTSAVRELSTYRGILNTHENKLKALMEDKHFTHIAVYGELEEAAAEKGIVETESLLSSKRSSFNFHKTKRTELVTKTERLKVIKEEHQVENADEIAEEVGKLTDRIAKGKRALHFVDQYNKAVSLKDGATRAQSRIARLGKFKEKMIEAEYLVLSQFIDSMNESISSVSSLIFDSPIDITFSVYKEIKTGNRVKPQINFTAQYKGMKMERIAQLSGGEQDRLSLCVILALNKFFDLPILMLDEVIASLDAELREKCISAIKSCFSDAKPVVLICHDTMEGIFDHVVSI